MGVQTVTRMPIVFVAFIVAMAAFETANAGKFNRKLNAGHAAPVWGGLRGIDDKTHSLEDLKEAKAVVVMFTCNHCPVSSGYEERFIEMTRGYQDKGVVVVAINSSRHSSDSFDKMKTRAAESKFNFAYLQDAKQEIAKAYGVTVTPQLFLLDGERKVAYMGAFDDSFDPRKVETHYLREALDAVLAGNQPEIRESRPFGCGLRYE